MRKLMPWVLMLLSACGGGAATSTRLVEQTTTAGPATNTEAPVSTTDAPVTTVARGESGGVIPADCAEGFVEHLRLIEPVVADLDPASAMLGEFYGFDEAAPRRVWKR